MRRMDIVVLVIALVGLAMVGPMVYVLEKDRQTMTDDCRKLGGQLSYVRDTNKFGCYQITPKLLKEYKETSWL